MRCARWYESTCLHGPSSVYLGNVHAYINVYGMLIVSYACLPLAGWVGYVFTDMITWS